MKMLVRCSLLVVLCATALASVTLTSASASGRTGRIVVKLIPPKGATSSGFAVVCAVNAARKVVGKCGSPNKHNVAVLTHVPSGRWQVEGDGGVGGLTYPRRVRVRAGKTTTLTWHVPMWG